MSYESEKTVALGAVREAARFCRIVRERMVDADALEKADRSPVTVADFGSQALVCRMLARAFADDPVVAEEDSADLEENSDVLDAILGHMKTCGVETDGDTLRGWIDRGNGAVSGRYWTIDPIDGTKGFLRQDQYAVALALVEDGEVRLGALACPALPSNESGGVGAVFLAVRGKGTEMLPLEGDATTGTRLSVDTDPKSGSMRFVESVESGHGNQSLQAEVARAVHITAPSLRMDSQAKYAAVARGDAVLYLRLPSPKANGYAEKIWDHAAGSIVVEEAGGQVTDMHGKPLDWSKDYLMRDNRGVVVSNGTIHDAVIQAMASMAETER